MKMKIDRDKARITIDGRHIILEIDDSLNRSIQRFNHPKQNLSNVKKIL